MDSAIHLYTRTKKKSGFILPVILVCLVVCSIIAMALTARFSGEGSREFLRTQYNSKYYSAALGGIDRAVFKLKSPNDTTQKTIWNEGNIEEFTVDMNKTKIKIKIEHTYWED